MTGAVNVVDPRAVELMCRRGALKQERDRACKTRFLFRLAGAKARFAIGLEMFVNTPQDSSIPDYLSTSRNEILENITLLKELGYLTANMSELEALAQHCIDLPSAKTALEQLKNIGPIQ